MKKSAPEESSVMTPQIRKEKKKRCSQVASLRDVATTVESSAIKHPNVRKRRLITKKVPQTKGEKNLMENAIFAASTAIKRKTVGKNMVSLTKERTTNKIEGIKP